MKKLYSLILILMVLGFALTALLLVYTPDTVPIHYNAAGEIDRFGSKYEIYTFPSLAAADALLFLLMARQRAKKGENSEEKALLIVALCSLVLLLSMGFYFQWKAMRYEPAAGAGIDGIVRLLALLIGFMLIVLGGVMPKTHRNALFGLRTKWSMENDWVWEKTQRFGGFATVIFGLLLVTVSPVLSEKAAMMFMSAAFLLWLAACLLGSWRIWKKDSQSNDFSERSIK